MSPSEANAKVCIRDAAMRLLSTKGKQHITIREIAKMAGVNVAAINYHFGSKEALLEEASRHYCAEADRFYAHLEDSSIPARERFQYFCAQFITYTLANSGVEKGMMSQVMAEEQINPQLVENIKKNMGSIKKCISDLTGDREDLTLNLKATQTISCLMYPILMCRYGHAALGIGLDDQAVRDKYIQMLIENLEHR